jgi:hypothetical protein
LHWTKLFQNRINALGVGLLPNCNPALVVENVFKSYGFEGAFLCLKLLVKTITYIRDIK